MLVVFSFHLVICTLASMASPQYLTQLICSFWTLSPPVLWHGVKQGKLQPSTGKEQLSFSSLKNLGAQKRKPVQKRSWTREVSLGEGQEGRKTKCDDITLQFLHVLELLPTCSAFRGTSCSGQRGAASPSTECHWPPFSPREEQEMAVLPVSPAEGSGNELKKVFKQSCKFTRAITCLWEQQHKRREHERWQQWFLLLRTRVLLIFM